MDNRRALELTTLINTIANLMATSMDETSLALAAVLFTQLGDTLVTINTANEALNIEREET